MRDAAPDPAPRRRAIGLDVGGTKVAGGVVDLATGAILHRRRAASGGDGAALLARVVAMARDLRDAGGGPLAGIGLGVAELVDPEAQTIFSGHRIPWEGIDVAGALAAVAPARIEADVRAAALAEARFGAGAGLRDFLYVTVGTGVSAVSVRGGIPYAGARGAALVIANGPVRHRCPACGAETVEVLEDVSSGPALAAAAGAADAEAALAAATAGEPRARAAVARAGEALGRLSRSSRARSTPRPSSWAAASARRRGPIETRSPAPSRPGSGTGTRGCCRCSARGSAPTRA